MKRTLAQSTCGIIGVTLGSDDITPDLPIHQCPALQGRILKLIFSTVSQDFQLDPLYPQG